MESSIASDALWRWGGGTFTKGGERSTKEVRKMENKNTIANGALLVEVTENGEIKRFSASEVKIVDGRPVVTCSFGSGINYRNSYDFNRKSVEETSDGEVRTFSLGANVRILKK